MVVTFLSTQDNPGTFGLFAQAASLQPRQLEALPPVPRARLRLWGKDVPEVPSPAEGQLPGAQPLAAW